MWGAVSTEDLQIFYVTEKVEERCTYMEHLPKKLSHEQFSLYASMGSNIDGFIFYS